MENQEIVTTIATLAPTVAAEHAEYEAAVAAEHAAEVALLQAAIETARPALRAISSRIKIGNRWSGGANGCNPWEEKTYHDERGLYLDPDESVGPAREKRGDQNSGSFGGADYFLLTDGRILRVKYSGSWSYWQGSVSEWESESEVVSPESLSSERIHDAIRAIAAALQNQIDGEKTKRTKAATERAAKISAVTALLGGR